MILTSFIPEFTLSISKSLLKYLVGTLKATHVPSQTCSYFLPQQMALASTHFLKPEMELLFIYLYLERGEGKEKERERERNISV